jgi:ribose-phosphate pyrophosphokinase
VQLATLTSKDLALEVGRELGITPLRFAYGSHPDGEQRVMYLGQLPDLKGEEVWIVQSGYPKEVFDVIGSLAKFFKYKHAEVVKAVVPYIPYLTQEDEHMAKNEVPIGAEKMLQLNNFAGYSDKLFLDELYVVNPHSSSVISKCMPFKGIIDATPLIAEEFKKMAKEGLFDLGDAAVIAPDDNAGTIARSLALTLGIPYDVFGKKRVSPTEVELTGGKLHGIETGLIYDDVIKTGDTCKKAIEKLKNYHGFRKFVVSCVHPVMTLSAKEILTNAGAMKIFGTNSIENDYGIVSLAPLIVSKIKT